MTSLFDIIENEDIFQLQLLPYLSVKGFVRLQSASKKFGNNNNNAASDETCWKILCQRDFGETSSKNKSGPAYDLSTNGYGILQEYRTYKELYQGWSKWQHHTCNRIKPHHAIEAIETWSRCKVALRNLNLTQTLNSLEPPPSNREFYERAPAVLPSSLLAFYSVHAGQRNLTAQSTDEEFFAGLFGSYSCYNAFYSMRLIPVHESPLEWGIPTCAVVGVNVGNPRTFLVLDFSDEEEESMYFAYPGNMRHLVCRGGILSYFKAFTERLENQIYSSSIIHPDSPSSLGISVFPETGDVVSVAITNGIEVRASARWFPDPTHGAMSFGYSIRIRLVSEDNEEGGRRLAATSCQLVDRNWEFHYEDGTVNRVQGEGVIGKQPIFFRRDDGTSGFIDMGPGGSGETKINTTFVYQSQSGPVPGTSSTDISKTKNAYVRGSFGFRPGSIDAPLGPLFLVTVGEFPLRANLPFF